LRSSGVRLDLINNDFKPGEEDRLRAEGKPGEEQIIIIKQMLGQRAKLQDAVIDELSHAIISSFEAEMRARKLVELGFLEAVLKELITLGQELGIKDELKEAVTEALRLAGVRLNGEALDKKVSGMDATKQTEITKVVDPWVNTYRSVAETRRMLVGLAGGYGTPATDLNRLLHGKPPLQAVLSKDKEAAQTSSDVLMGAPKDASFIIQKFKGDNRDPDPRDSQSEATLLRYLFTARVMELTVDIPLGMISLWQNGPGESESPVDFSDRARNGLKGRLDSQNKSFWGGVPDYGLSGSLPDPRTRLRREIPIHTRAVQIDSRTTHEVHRSGT
jgi:hypothetical protein